MWTRGWEKALEIHILKSVRVSGPQSSEVKNLVTDAFIQGKKLSENNKGEPAAFEHIMHTARALLFTSDFASAVMQTLQDFVVDPATTFFALYTAKFRMLVSNARCVEPFASEDEPFAPEDGTMQLAIKTSIDDQYATWSIFAGRNLLAFPFDNVDALMGTLEDLSLNQTPAAKSTRKE